MVQYRHSEIEYDSRDIQWERNYDADYDNLSDIEVDLNNISFNG